VQEKEHRREEEACCSVLLLNGEGSIYSCQNVPRCNNKSWDTGQRAGCCADLVIVGKVQTEKKKRKEKK